MRIKRLKIKNILITLLVIFLIIFGLVKYLTYINSNYYKLKEIGYQKEEISIIEKNLTKDEIIDIQGFQYNNVITDFIIEKYFIYNNLKKYVNYYKDNKDAELSSIITVINTHSNYDFYTNIKSADTSKGILTLINKYYKINKSFEAKNLVDMSLQYSYSGNRIVNEVYDAYVDMCVEAKKEDLTIITTSSYRNYTWQEKLYNQYVEQQGEAYADSISARPGHSEHELGLALDIVSYGVGLGEFENTEEFLWLKDNAYKYGFILRYPEDKTAITGYNYEPWHYRYVGKEVAKYIYKNNITFDEYYAYFVENK